MGETLHSPGEPQFIMIGCKSETSPRKFIQCVRCLSGLDWQMIKDHDRKHRHLWVITQIETTPKQLVQTFCIRAQMSTEH